MLSTLRYNPKEDVFRSPNGDLKRSDNIKTEPASILGEWSGLEWDFEEESELAKTKEKIALGLKQLSENPWAASASTTPTCM